MIAAYIINIRLPFLAQIPSGFVARAVRGKFVALEGGKEMITEAMPYEVEKKIDDGRLILSEQKRAD